MHTTVLAAELGRGIEHTTVFAERSLSPVSLPRALLSSPPPLHPSRLLSSSNQPPPPHLHAQPPSHRASPLRAAGRSGCGDGRWGDNGGAPPLPWRSAALWPWRPAPHAPPLVCLFAPASPSLFFPLALGLGFHHL